MVVCWILGSFFWKVFGFPPFEKRLPERGEVQETGVTWECYRESLKKHTLGIQSHSNHLLRMVMDGNGT